MSPKAIWTLLKETFSEWSEDKASRLAAALAYYTVFSLGPLLIVVIAIAGVVFGQEAARGQIVAQAQGLIGRSGAQAVQTIIQNARQPTSGIVATSIGIVTLLLGASGVFGQLQDALNTIWEVMPKPGRGLMGAITDRFVSFTMVLGIGFLLLVSLVLSAVLTGLATFFGDVLPIPGFVLQIVDFVVSFAVITLLFAMIYKVLPDVEIAWGDVWIGAAMTSLLFTIGKFLIGLYLGRSAVTSTYGAAGSLVVILLWVYYSAQILFFGAEFTQVHARRYGSRIVPTEDAIPVTEKARAEQGIPHRETTEEAAPAQEQRAPKRLPGRALGFGVLGFIAGLVFATVRHSRA
ncbi:MAG TPA: ribonuclease BN [Chloroflexi bacterium]|nr:ribonuclease BN [Chloroflexota bacterium]